MNKNSFHLIVGGLWHPPIWIGTKRWMHHNKSFQFTLSPDTSNAVPAVFKGSNGFDYFNIFDYFMNERITAVTFMQSKGIFLGKGQYFNAHTDFPIQSRANWFFFNKCRVVFLKSGIPLKNSLRSICFINLCFYASSLKLSFATDDYSIFLQETFLSHGCKKCGN